MIFFAYDCQMAKFTEVTYTLWGFLGNGGVAGEDGGVAGEDGIMVGGGIGALEIEGIVALE